MDTLKRLFSRRVSRKWIIGLRRINTATASQTDMDKLLELTWRQRIRANEERRTSAVQRQRMGLEVVPSYLRRQAL
jgi:hypothetical protein